MSEKTHVLIFLKEKKNNNILLYIFAHKDLVCSDFPSHWCLIISVERCGSSLGVTIQNNIFMFTVSNIILIIIK